MNADQHKELANNSLLERKKYVLQWLIDNEYYEYCSKVEILDFHKFDADFVIDTSKDDDIDYEDLNLPKPKDKIKYKKRK